jgi:hypothetical protein
MLSSGYIRVHNQKKNSRRTDLKIAVAETDGAQSVSDIADHDNPWAFGSEQLSHNQIREKERGQIVYRQLAFISVGSSVPVDGHDPSTVDENVDMANSGPLVDHLGRRPHSGQRREVELKGADFYVRIFLREKPGRLLDLGDVAAREDQLEGLRDGYGLDERCSQRVWRYPRHHNDLAPDVMRVGGSQGAGSLASTSLESRRFHDGTC